MFVAELVILPSVNCSFHTALEVCYFTHTPDEYITRMVSPVLLCTDAHKEHLLEWLALCLLLSAPVVCATLLKDFNFHSLTRLFSSWLWLLFINLFHGHVPRTKPYAGLVFFLHQKWMWQKLIIKKQSTVMWLWPSCFCKNHTIWHMLRV